MLGARPLSHTQLYASVSASHVLEIVAADPSVSCVHINGHAAIWDVHQVFLVAIGTLLGSMVCETPAVMKADTAARANIEKCIVKRSVTAIAVTQVSQSGSCLKLLNTHWNETERSTSRCLLKEKS